MYFPLSVDNRVPPLGPTTINWSAHIEPIEFSDGTFFHRENTKVEVVPNETALLLKSLILLLGLYGLWRLAESIYDYLWVTDKK